MASTNPWIAVVGTRADGRQRVLARLERALAAEGAALGGFHQRPVLAGDEVVGYEVVRVPGGRAVPLTYPSEEPRLCGWGFHPAAFETARAWTLRPGPEVCFLDVGRLEAAGAGHWPTVTAALEDEATKLLVIGVRPAVLAPIALALPDPFDAVELPASEAEERAFLARVRRAWRDELAPAAGGRPAP